VSDVYADGLWRKRQENESSRIFRVEGAHVFSDRWQAGGALPIQQRANSEDSSAGLGDGILSVGYEYLPDWEYHPIRPKGVGFLQLTLPTGRSIYESEEENGLDSRGRGFWAIGAGTLLTKNFLRYDFFSSLELHHAFSKTVEHDGYKSRLTPGEGGSLAIGAGYNLTDFRFGAGIAWTYEAPIDVSGSVLSSNGTLQRSATMNIVATYFADAEWATMLSYSDQTLMGSPLNTSLERSVRVQLQRRWER